MHTVRAFSRGDGITTYRVGYYDPNPKMDNWQLIGEFTDVNDALAYVSFLNGGAKPSGPPIASLL
jgi:hypothetical protein